MENECLWPVEYNDKLWYEKDCDELYVDMYEFRLQLNSEGGIYLSEDIWIYPDGSMGEW
jgi:hypothetical protein